MEPSDLKPRLMQGGRLKVLSIILVVCIQASLGYAQSAKFTKNQCQDFAVSKGDGEGVLRYCDNGVDQMIYHSGELDEADSGPDRQKDLRAIQAVLRQFKKRDNGTFRVVTKESGGGNVDWHQKLIMGVEDACVKNCAIVTEVNGKCESACNQLHITCVKNARTIIHRGGETCDHATTDDDCEKCDPNPPRDCDICGPKESVSEYQDRCEKLTQGRNLSIDSNRKKMVIDYANHLANSGVFNSSKFKCNNLPWAEIEESRPANRGHSHLVN